MSRSRRLSARWRLAGAGLVTVALVWLLASRQAGGFAELSRSWRAMPAAGLFAAMTLSALALVLSIVRWRVVLAGAGRPVSFGSCSYAVLATWPIAAVSPSRAGDLVRPAFLRERVGARIGVASVLVEKGFDAHSLAVLSVIGAALAGWWLSGVLAVAFLVVFWGSFVLLPDLQGMAERRGLVARVVALLVSIGSLRRAPLHLIGLVTLSLLGWLLSAGIIAALLDAAGAGVPWLTILAIWPLASLAGALPVTLSGIGTRDAAFLYLLELARGSPISPAAVLAATLLYPVITNYLFALAGMPFLIHALRRMALGVGSSGGASV